MRRSETPAYEVQVLGCKANQYDAQQIRRVLESAGFHACAGGETAAAAVVHTCAVTAEAARKCRQLIRRLRQAHPRARLVVTGCLAGAGLREQMPEVDAWVPAGPGWLGRFAQTLGLPVEAADDDLPIRRFAGHTRAFLKIQDGCDLGCSYCVVPRLRGPPREKPVSRILEEARALVASGHREIVVSGVCVGLYGRGGGPSLAEVLRQLLAVPGLERLRLSSLHPEDLSEALCEVASSSAKMVPHVHLPLQSGSDRILAAMRRGYTVATFRAAVERARNAFSEPAITTDVIVGFPGETEEDFERTIETCRAIGFARMHVFPYSARPGTAAAKFPSRVPAPVVRERSRVLRRVAQELAREFQRNFVGRVERVLVENCAPDGTCQGHAERYFTVRFSGRREWVGRVIPVRITRACAEGTWGVLESPTEPGKSL